MDRRTFLKSTGLATAGITSSMSLAGTSLASDAQNFTLAVSPNIESIFGDLISRRIAEALEASTDRALQIIGHDGGKTLNADFRLEPIGKLAAVHSGFELFSPLLSRLPAPAYDGWLAAGGGEILLDELAFRADCKCLLVGHGLAPLGLWSKRDLTGRIDLSGLTISANGPAAKIFAAAGAAIQSDSDASGPTADLVMSRGAVTDLEIDVHNAMRLYQTPVLTAGGEPYALVMARKDWEKLSVSHRSIIQAIASASDARVKAEAWTTTKTITEAQQDYLQGYETGPLPTPIESGLRQAVIDHVDAIAGSDRISRQIADSLAGYLRITGIDPERSAIGDAGLV